jgi:hypothetical protein
MVGRPPRPLVWPICAALALLLVVQTIRIEGLRIWPIKIAGLKAERDQWRSAEHDWRRAAEIMRGASTRCTRRLGPERRRRASRPIARRARRRQAGLGQAAQRGTALEAMAKQIEAAPPVAGACRTPDAVMAAKGEL